MKKILLLIFLQIILAKVYAQNNQVIVQSAKKNVAINLLTNELIKGEEYIFPEIISNFEIDSNSLTGLVNLRGYIRKVPKSLGKGVVYDFNNQKVNYFKIIRYLYNEAMALKNGEIFYINTFKTFKLNANDGKEIWQLKNQIFYINPTHKIALGYKRSSFDGSLINKINAIDLSNGEILWEKQFSDELTLTDIISVNDSTIILIANGINYLNIYTGNGWKFGSGTEYVVNSHTSLLNSLGILSGVLTGTYIFSVGKTIVTNICSNLLTDSTNYYIATKFSIDKLDQNGKSIWFNSIPFDKTSKSIITKENENLFLLNEGYAYVNGRSFPKGEPYFASYNAEDGKEKFFTVLSNDKKALVSSSILKDSCLYACLGNQLIACSKENGRIIKSIELGEKEKKFPEIIGNQVFYQTPDSGYQPLNKTFSETLNVYDGKNSVLSLNKNFDIVSRLDESKLWTKSYQDSEITILHKNDKSIVLNNKNMMIMQFDHKIMVRRIKDDVFIADGTRILKIPSSALH